MNEVMRETLEELKIKHVTTSPYHLQSNAKVKKFHKTLAKLAVDSREDWDLYLT